MSNNNMIYSTILIVLMVAYVATAFTTPLARITTTKQSTSHMSMARRGGGLQRELDDDGSVGRSSSSSSSSPSSSWLNTNKSIKELPTEEGKNVLIETGAFLLVDKGTNPKGAVSAMKYEGETYCFEANCPQCKVPMTKANVFPPNEETDNKAPRVSCDLCKSTYNMKTGEKLQATESAGLFGGMAKAVLGSKDSGPMATYQLGEKNGKIMFTMDGM